MNLHERAKYGFEGLPLTLELLNERNKAKDTVWHLAARHNTLKDIPQHIFEDRFIKQALNQTNESENTVWHYAAMFNSLNAIPKRLFTTEVFNQINKFQNSNSVLHLAAVHNSLKDIPKHIFSKMALYQKEHDGRTVWELASAYDTLKTIPRHLITKDILSVLRHDGDLLFDPLLNKVNTDYVNSVISERDAKFDDFIANHPQQAKELVHRDPRLALSEIKNNILFFSFDGLDYFEERIVLNDKGVFLKNRNHESLKNVVTFIENNYPNIEKSIVLPKIDNSKVEDFYL